MTIQFVMRLVVVVLLGTVMAVPASGAALQATPESVAGNPFADLGLPQIEITMTDTAFEGVPPELDAGRYVVALTNAMTEEEFSGGGTFLQLPEGMTAADFIAFVAPPSATPIAEDVLEATPVAEEGEGPPAWYYETRIAGGPYAMPGETSYAVVELTAGEWVFWAEYPAAPQTPRPITVTGDIPADAPTPQADVTIEMADFAFNFSEPLSAGLQIIELPSVGDQPHFIGVASVPEGTTAEALIAFFEREFGGAAATPMATPVDGLTLDNVVEVFGTGDQSAGTTAWYAVDLEAGTYAAVCFVTDPETGLPHIMLGMIEIFEVD